MSVVFFSPDHGSWVRYERPAAVFEAHRHDEIPGLLAHLEGEVERTGLHAVGFLAYEAGSAFDAAMPAAPCTPFPLAWFGLYGPPLTIHLDATTPAPALAWTSELNEPSHSGALARIREHLACGETYQVNFTHRLRARFDGDPWALFCRLAARQPSPHCAYVDTGDFAVCCASPEMFFEREGETVRSRPMKGTAPRGRWAGEDRAMAERLMGSEKERAENVMIVDMVRNDLGRVCRPGSVRAPELFRAERYPTLWQLTSLVEGMTTLPTAEVMAALFPAASITGAPKVRTMHLINELEVSPRRIYTGTIGVMLPGRRARFNVAIRTVLVDRKAGTAEYGVGGGIVWDSAPRDEYRETLLKARVLDAPAPEFSLLETMRWSRATGVFLLEEHLSRVAESAEYFGFRLDVEGLRAEIEAAVRNADGTGGVLRLTVAGGSVGLEPRPLPAPWPCRVALARTPVDSRDPFLFHKTTRRAVYERARAEVPGMDDALLVNERGEVTESTIANLVFELDGDLLTPPLESGLLPGTLRAALLRAGRIRERVVHVRALSWCSRMWLINSVRGWRRATLADRDKS
ncbi:aminodeoxychorismate synthase component I [Desulfomicrobium escambiense]|uniref:aminodeoxychorismate synthase component I n=1 Tax=Desulfomicrobium escambiense TaxID=29503 RepID=UPI0005C1526F|nr:aminodeoxychorismate synthase component I [Desulfomicrobium escambiense]